MLSAEFLLALSVYAALVIISVPCFNNVHRRLQNSILDWPWEHIARPLLRALLMMIFIGLAYPVIFGVSEAPPLFDLLSGGNHRLNLLLNLMFLVTLGFPMLPLLGKQDELILPVQAILACSLLFSWLAAHRGLPDIHYWPGLLPVLFILIIAFITHWLANYLSHHAGHFVDEKLGLAESSDLLSRAFILFMQSPAILLYSSALGKQLL